MFSPNEIAVMQQHGVTPPVITAQMLAYTHLRYILLFVRELVVWLSLWIVLETKLHVRFRSIAERLPQNRLLRIFLFSALLAIVLTILRFPFNYYSNFVVEHDFGLSHQPFFSWLEDLLKARSVDVVLSTIGWFLAFWTIDKFPRRWPLILWGALTPVIAAAIFVYPLVVDPLFNKYAPMPPGNLLSSIKTLAQGAGIPDAPVFVVDKSKQTTKLNAEVTGLGPSARVVIWDTTLKIPTDQIESIVGHELGHYALGHIFIGFTLSIVGLLLGLLIAGRYKEQFIAWLPKRWQIKGATDLAAIPVLMLAGALLSFIADPVDNGISRYIEHQADAFGLQLTGNGPAMARAFVSLSNENLSDPDPPALIQFWFFSHPSLRERICFVLGITNDRQPY